MTTHHLGNENAMNIPRELLAWYHKNKRDLPWRLTKEPYKIWLSEIMAQQTRIDTVIPYYLRFLEQFPTIEDLAVAEEEKVLKLWEGLGYYSRARNMMKCARVIVEQFGGTFPVTLKEMMSLPGIGAYSAGAILSIAFDLQLPAVDGNVMRVFSRVYGIEEDIANQKSKKTFEAKVLEMIPPEAGNFNQSIMELGAIVCVPNNPKCNICPIQAGCVAKEQGRVNELPVKSTQMKPQKLEMAVAVVYLGDRLLLHKREDSGLLASLWGLPIIESKAEEGYNDLLQYVEKEFHCKIQEITDQGKEKHIFTHRIWEMRIYKMKVQEINPSIDSLVSATMNSAITPKIVWVNNQEIKNYSLPTAFKKVLVSVKC